MAPPAPAAEEKVVDLMAALEASVRDAKEARKRHPTAQGGGGRGRRRTRTTRRQGRQRRRRPSKSSKTRKASEGGARRRQGAADRASPAEHRACRRSRSRAASSPCRTSTRSSIPETGTTKAEVIEYYARVAPTMVPHLEDRGVTLRRFPNGVDGGSFFEKRCPSHRPGVAGHGPRARRPQRQHRLLLPRLGPGAGVGGQHGRARDPRPDGPGVRHRQADDARVRPGPGRAGGDRRVRRRGPRHPPRARRLRPGGLPEDVGVEGHAGLRARSTGRA